MSEVAPFTGGCACGAVRYECTAEPVAMLNCHCRTCQKITGGAYVPVVVVQSTAFRVTRGEIRYHFTDRVKGVPHKRGFCSDCGSRLTGAESETPSSTIGLTASSLDDSSWFRPQYDIFTSHAQPWDVMDPKLPKHRHYPPT
jgi:hypothetical protein